MGVLGGAGWALGFLKRAFFLLSSSPRDGDMGLEMAGSSEWEATLLLESLLP